MSDETPPRDNEDAPEMPAVIKQAAWLWHHTQANRELFMKAPVLAFAVIALTVGYWFGSSRDNEELRAKDETLNTRNERISFLDDQLTAYKDRLQGATPDEAAKRFSTLERKIEDQNRKLQVVFPDNKRHLSDSSIKSMEVNIDRIKKDVKYMLIYAYSIGDSPFYAQEFVEFFKNHATIPFLGAILTPCDGDQRGVMIGLIDIERPSAEAVDFAAVLKEAGLHISNTTWKGTSPPLQGQDFDLFICPEEAISAPGAPLPTPMLPNTRVGK
jgi:hypothetical protein